MRMDEVLHVTGQSDEMLKRKAGGLSDDSLEECLFIDVPSVGEKTAKRLWARTPPLQKYD